MKFKFLIRIFFLFSLILVIMYLVMKSKQVSFIYSDFGVKIPVDYPLLGIDVSHHQGDINYEEVVHAGHDTDSIQFVYIKATEGESHKDRHYDPNAEGFAAHRINYGFYHYYQPKTSAVKQAEFFCEVIDGFNFKLRPVVDIEVASDMRKNEIIDSLVVFQDYVEQRLDIRPMIYTYVSYYEDYFISSKLSHELFWLASYNRRNPYIERDNVIMWQFTEKARVDGIGTPVDMNVAKTSFLKKVLLLKFQN